MRLDHLLSREIRQRRSERPECQKTSPSAASGPRGSHESQAGHPESRIARRGRDFSREHKIDRKPEGPSVPKVFRAHGGCLGAGSRRRARQAAIVPGEPHTGFDPGVPEWGNPAGEGLLPTQCGRQPGELKHLSTPRRGNQEETPPVAASERGPAQTGAREKRAGAAAPGLRMRRPGPARPGRSHKARAQRKTHGKARGTGLEPRTRRHVPAGRSPEYRRARGTRREAGGTAPQG